jgi:hypothetical protein
MASAKFDVSEFVMPGGGVPAGLLDISGAGGSVVSRILAQICSHRRFICELSEVGPTVEHAGRGGLLSKHAFGVS